MNQIEAYWQLLQELKTALSDEQNEHILTCRECSSCMEKSLELKMNGNHEKASQGIELIATHLSKM